MQTKQSGNHQPAAVTVLDVSGMNDRMHQQPHGIDKDMPLLAFDFLPRIIAMRIDIAGPPFPLRSSHSDYQSRRRWGWPRRPACSRAFHIECVMNVFQCPIITPPIKIIMNGATWREILPGYRATGIPSQGYSIEAVHDLTEVDCAFVAAWFGRRDQWFDNLQPTLRPSGSWV